MFVVQLLLLSILAEEAEIQQEATKAKLLDDYEKNIKAISEAKAENRTEVILLGEMRTRTQFYNANEFKVLLEQEKNNECGFMKDFNAKIAGECVVCRETVLTDKSDERLFEKRVNEKHNQMPICVMCPNPRCSGRLCCGCACTVIKDAIKNSATRIKYFDKDIKPISDQRMALCPVCRGYLNIELSELEFIPNYEKLTDNAKLDYLEDLVCASNKRYWLLETIATADDSLFKKLLMAIYELNNSEISCDVSQNRLLEDLTIQNNFYSACTQEYDHFNVRVHHIKAFIEKCTEQISYPFVTYLKDIIASSDLSSEELEEAFKDICASVPIEHADRFSVIYYAMIIGYFEKTKDYNKNLQFIIRWILSKYSFILTGFRHKRAIVNEETKYYPLANHYYTAFSDALHDPQLIDNIINCNALEFTFRGLSYYPRESTAAYEMLISIMVGRYYEQLAEENCSVTYNGIFVNKHSADTRRFSYAIYRRVLALQSRHANPTDFNESNREILLSLPAFIYDAILKVLLTLAPPHFSHIAEKITKISTSYSCDKKYADFLHETYKAKACTVAAIKASIEKYLVHEDYPNAIFLFKNLPDASATRGIIDLFKEMKILPELLKRLNRYEFVNWENETLILNLLKEHEPKSIEALLKQMSMQASCFYKVPKSVVDSLIRKYNEDYGSIGSLAFVCTNRELLGSFRADLERILSTWGFAQDLENFYKGVISPEGTKNIFDLPFFKMYYAELFAYIDKNIADKALKLSRMLMVAKLAVRDLSFKMEEDSSESSDDDKLVPDLESMETKSALSCTLEMEILKAVAKTTVQYEAFCAFQCYLSPNLKKHLEEMVLPNIVAIDDDSEEPIMEEELRVFYRKLLKLQTGLNFKDEGSSCSEEEMRKFLEVLSALEPIEEFGALDSIKSKN
ncbi:hypothetical protein ENBRE01_2899 [Enteropsectra breve]|nr:hypothetical protein ENBRE01_2899 [Enteropsectra breve]